MGVLLGGGNSNILYFHPYFGEDEPNLTHIFQMGWFNHPAVWEVFAFFGETFSDSKSIEIRRKWKIGGLLISKEISHARRARMARLSDEPEFVAFTENGYDK